MDSASIEEIFAPFGSVKIKNMFGGKGIYLDGLIVACDIDGDLVFKADATSSPQFAAAGSRQWSYEHKDGNDKRVFMPYWTVPDAAFDDPDEMGKWVRLALEAARRGKK